MAFGLAEQCGAAAGRRGAGWRCGPVWDDACEDVRHSGKPLPLAFASEGDDVVIASFGRGRRFSAKLAALGLGRGSCLRILKAASGQPMLIAVGDTRLALCSGMAQKIFVVPVAAPAVIHQEEEYVHGSAVA